MTRFGAIVCLLGLLAGITLFGPSQATAQATGDCPAGYDFDTSLGLCARFEPAEQADDMCPDGSHGEAPDCYIVVARGPADPPECVEGTLTGELCVIVGDPPEATEGECPVSPTVFLSADGFCYTVVTAACLGDTISVDGECRSPVDIQPGPLTCLDPLFSFVGGTCIRFEDPQGDPPSCVEGTLTGPLCVIEGDPPVATQGECPVSNTVFLDPGGLCYEVVAGICPAFAVDVGGECRREADREPGPDECPDPLFAIVDGECTRSEEPQTVPPSCPEGSEEDPATLECREPVDPKPGDYFCADPEAALNGTSCVFTAEPLEADTYSLTIKKLAPDAEPGQLFDFEDPNGNPAPLGDGDAVVFEGFETGDFASFTEFIPDGWTDPIVNCEGTDNEVGIPLPPSQLDIEVQFDVRDIVCTVTNVLIDPLGLSLTIKKEAPDAAPGQLFEFAGPDGSTVFLGDGDEATFDGFEPGTNTFFSEFLPIGWADPAIDCTNTDEIGLPFPGLRSIDVNFEFGTEDVVCTVTNQPGPTASLTVIKEVVGGDPTQTDFSFSDGYSTIGSAKAGESFTTTINSGFFDLFEDQIDGWRVVSIDCTGALFTSPTPEFRSVFLEVEPDSAIECTFVNEAVRPVSLELTKIVEEPDPADIAFNFFESTTGESVDLSNGDSYIFDVPNGLFSVQEFGEPDWYASDFTCSDGESSWSADPSTGSASFEVDTTGVADDVDLIACTVTNSPTLPATLKLTKIIEGEDDGSTFSIDAPNGPYDLGHNDSVTIDLDFVGFYFIGEYPSSDWLTPIIECSSTNPDTAFNSFDENSVEFTTVNPGDEIECTVTNERRIPATLKITKIIEGEDDGSEFTFGTSAGDVTIAGGESTTIELPLGSSHYVVEQIPDGWFLNELSCTSSNESMGIDEFSSSALFEDVADGDEIECTFTNELDGPSTVTIQKIVDPSTDPTEFAFFTPNGFDLLGHGDSLTFDATRGSTVFVTESFPIGWAAEVECSGTDDITTSTSISGASAQIVPTPNDDIVCTFTNTAVPPIPLNVTKEVTADDDGSTFDFFVAGSFFTLTAGQTQTIDVFPGQTVGLEELAELGWQLAGVDCGEVAVEPANPSGTFFLLTVPEDAAEINCTFTNDPLPAAEVTIIKAVEGNDPQPLGSTFRFFTPDGTVFLGDGDQTTFLAAPGDIFVTEAATSFFDYWTLTNIDCGSADFTRDGDTAIISAEPGEQIECTFTNRWEPPATIAITKEVTGDPDGTVFGFAHTQGTVFAEAGQTVLIASEPGINRVFESLASGWVLDTIECNGASYTIDDTDPLFSVAEIDVAVGDQIECTFTNRPASPSTLTFVKETIGAPADDATTFVISGLGDPIEFAVGAPTTIELDAGRAFFAEELIETPGWQFEGVSCTEDHRVSSTGSRPRMDVLIPSEADVTCTITNRKIEPVTITLNKTIIGGEDGQVFSFYGNEFGVQQLSLPNLGDGDSHTFTVNPGSFAIGEFVSPFWDEEIECVGDPEFSYAFFGGQVTFTAEAGDTIECSFTNTWNPPAMLTINKVIEGEPESTQPFRMFVNGALHDVAPGAPVTVPITTDTTAIFEQLPQGWIVSDISCTPNVITDQGDQWVNIQAADGDEVECTFTNRRLEQSRLIVKKVTDTATDTEFLFEGPTGSTYVGDGETTTIATVPPGSYSIYENLPGGWTLASIDCGDADFLRIPDSVFRSGVQVTVVEGEDVLCTFTNTTFDQPTVTITKAVDGVDDGTPFTFDTPYGTFTLSGGEQVAIDANPGFFWLNERATPGWAVTDLACDVDDAEYLIDDRSLSFTVAETDVACTITNGPTDVATLTVIKQVVGDAVDVEFPFSVNGPDIATLGPDESFTIDVTSGPNQIRESLPVGWEIVDVVCEGVTEQSAISFSNQRGVFITIPDGSNAVCTFTNEHTPKAQLTITKVIDGVGDVEPGTFTFQASPNQIVELAGGESVTIDIPVGRVVVAEERVAGWQVSEIVCVDAEDVAYRLNFQLVEFSVFEGDQVSCTFTNTPAPTATIALTKEIDGNDDGTTFVFEHGSAQYEVSAGETVIIPVIPGLTAVLSEQAVAGWVPSQFTCTNAETYRSFRDILLVRADSTGRAECTIVNQAVEPAVMKIRKEVSGLDDGTKFAFEGPSGESFVLGGGEEHTLRVPTGFNTVSELPSPDWTVDNISCDRQLNVLTVPSEGTVRASLDVGEVIECTYTNTLTDPPPTGTLTISKQVDGDSDGDMFTFVDPYGRSHVLGQGDSATRIVEAGVPLTVVEEPSGDWQIAGVTCPGGVAVSVEDRTLTVTVPEGAVVECTIVNAQPTPTPTSTSTPTPTPTSTSTPTPTPTSTSTPTPTATATVTPTPTSTPFQIPIVAAAPSLAGSGQAAIPDAGEETASAPDQASSATGTGGGSLANAQLALTGTGSTERMLVGLWLAGFGCLLAGFGRRRHVREDD